MANESGQPTGLMCSGCHTPIVAGQQCVYRGTYPYHVECGATKFSERATAAQRQFTERMGTK